jgi:hypothetical protein
MWQEWEAGELLRMFWRGDPKERTHLEDLGVDGRIILKCAFKKCDGEAWIGFIWLWIGRAVGCCVCGNEL